MTAEGQAAPDALVAIERPAVAASGADTPILIVRTRVTGTLWMLVAGVLALALLHLAVIDSVADKTARRFLDLLSLDGEQCLPAWFSATMMAAAALLMTAAGLAARRADPANARPWFVLSAIFVYFSFDEIASVHERIGEMVARLHDFGGLLSFDWVVVAGPVLVLGVLAFIPFLRRLPAPAGRRLFTAGVVFVAGAFGCELAGGYLFSSGGLSFWYWAEVFAEEALEMSGLVLAIGAILGYLAQVAPRLPLHFSD